MSDYLWDKKGETDAEVERLEALLSTFRHAPRALELPAEEATVAARRPRGFGARLHSVAARLFEPVGLAAAAALLLACLLGAGALLLGRSDADENRAASHDARRTQPQPPSQAPPHHQASSGPRESSSSTRELAAAARGPEPANVEAKGSGGALVVRETARARTVARPAAFLKSRHRPAADAPAVAARGGEAGAPEAMSAGASVGAASLFDGTRMMAKEQLIYALRLTGAKLKEVQSRAHGAGDPKAAPGGVR